MRKSILGAVCACLAIVTSTSSMASIVTDQTSIGPIGGGYGGPVVQTFMPQQTNLAGVDAYLHGTGALSSDVTLKVWINSALRIGDPVANVTLLDVPRSTDMVFRFSPVFVDPGVEYALEFIIADALTMGAIIPGQYPDGAVIEGGGNLFNGGADLFFSTYYDDTFVSSVPIPSAVWLFGSGLLGLIGIARRKKS